MCEEDYKKMLFEQWVDEDNFEINWESQLTKWLTDQEVEDMYLEESYLQLFEWHS
jgi:hypothetical protein